VTRLCGVSLTEEGVTDGKMNKDREMEEKERNFFSKELTKENEAAQSSKLTESISQCHQGKCLVGDELNEKRKGCFVEKQEIFVELQRKQGERRRAKKKGEGR